MTISNLIDTTEIKKQYIFHHLDEENNKEVYFCNCGKKIEKKEQDGKSGEITIEYDPDDPYKDADILERFERDVIVCPKCEKDYSVSKNFQLIKDSNSYFYGAFKYENTEERLTLYKVRIKGACTSNSRFVRFKEVFSYISVDKVNKKIFVKDEDSKKEKEFNIDQVVKIVDNFYTFKDLDIVDKLIEVHKFISYLSDIVSDSKNMDVVSGLLSQMEGRPGIDVLKKITTIFFGIICYSNLSTIALTKGTVFLYDMMSNCRLPNVQTLSDNGVTSPLHIFNFLVSLEHEDIKKEIESENDNKFVYKSKKGGELNINFDLERFGFKRSSNIDMTEGSINVREELENKTVSKYIFKKIKSFKDYQTLIKYTKFIAYKDLIQLTMKHDIELLVNLFPLIEFRVDINMTSLNQMIHLVVDMLKTRHITYSNMRSIGDEKEEKKKEEVNLNYKLIPRLDFYEYDDSIMMIEELNWDRNKDFDKIKTVAELTEYHDQLSDHYNILSDSEKAERFKKFAKKFEYLEKYRDTLKVKVLSNPREVLNASKEMRNCAGSYVTRISKGKYILMLVWDKSKRRKPKEEDFFMMGLNVSNVGLEFDQFKASFNKPASNRQRKLVMSYLRNKDISYREKRDLRINRK